MKVKSLGPDLYKFVTTLTPIIAVDALIHNEQGQFLLTWREDEFFGPGWHVPGSVVRLGESFLDRLHAGIGKELNVSVEVETFLGYEEIFREDALYRPHTIVFVYLCKLTSTLLKDTQYLSESNCAPGAWKWFDTFPSSMIPEHEFYRKYFKPA